MMQIAYRAVNRFTDREGGWDAYVAGSGLPHLTEVVGLDVLLCRSLFPDWIDEDWAHLLWIEELGDCLDDCDYLLRRVGDLDGELHQVLAVAREPSTEDLRQVELPGFQFMGFDLIEEGTSISALTNCGGFEGAFEAADVTEWGLIASRTRAEEVRRALVTLFPEEPHADCTIWAVWRMTTAAEGLDSAAVADCALTETTTLWRPTGPEELALVRESGFRRWPPRLPEQPIFYPVTNEAYAVEIAQKWNARDGKPGFITRFEVEAAFMNRYDIQTVGGAVHTEWWVPAEDLEQLNDHIVGLIEVVREFPSCG